MRRRGRPPYPDILTPREWEVLELLREGLTNEEIAIRIGVSSAGAKYHVSEILSKLGVGRRQEAAAWQRMEEAPRPSWSNAFRGFFALKALGAATVAVAAAGIIGLAWAVISTNGDGSENSLASEPSVTEEPTPSPSAGPPTSSPDSLLPRVAVSGSAIHIADRDGRAEKRIASGLSPVWSPDGKEIAYVAASTGPGATGIDWVHDMKPDGTDSEEIGGYDWDSAVEGCAPYGLGAWAPDSNILAIWTGPGELHQSEIISVETGQAEPFGGCYSQWLPDGRLLYHAPCVTDPTATCINLMTGSDHSNVTRGQLGSISPNGKWLAVGRGADLYIRDMELGSEVLLANVALAPPGLPDWSPDSLSIAVSADFLYVVSLQNGAIQTLGRGMMPKWSPDGTRIAYYDYQTELVCGSRMRVVDAVDGQEIFSVPAVGHVFDWSPDGSQIAYSRNADAPAGCNVSITRPTTRVSTPSASTATPTPESTSTPAVNPLYDPAYRIPWDGAVELIRDCEVEWVLQAHSLFVWLGLKDEDRFSPDQHWHTIEPEIDLVYEEADAAQPDCGRIEYTTE